MSFWRKLAVAGTALWMIAVLVLLIAIWREASDISLMVYGIKEQGLTLR